MFQQSRFHLLADELCPAHFFIWSTGLRWVFFVFMRFIQKYMIFLLSISWHHTAGLYSKILSIETSNTSAILNANSREGVSQSPFFHPNLYTIFIRIHFSLIQILFAMSYNREQQGGKKYDGFNCTSVLYCWHLTKYL